MDLITRKRSLNSQNCSEDVQHMLNNLFQHPRCILFLVKKTEATNLLLHRFGFVLFAAKYKDTNFYILWIETNDLKLAKLVMHFSISKLASFVRLFVKIRSAQGYVPRFASIHFYTSVMLEEWQLFLTPCSWIVATQIDLVWVYIYIILLNISQKHLALINQAGDLHGCE